MIDHVTLNVRDLEACKAFYTQALSPLGYELMLDFVGGCGFGLEGKPDFFLAERGEPSAPTHVALRSPDRSTVDAFHRTALDAGYRDNGAPGARTIYHQGYYGAFVLDPDGNNVEAVFHDR